MVAVMGGGWLEQPRGCLEAAPLASLFLATM